MKQPLELIREMEEEKKAKTSVYQKTQTKETTPTADDMADIAAHLRLINNQSNIEGITFNIEG